MDDEVVNDIVMTLGVSFVMATLGALAIRGLPKEERFLPQLSLAIHLVTGPSLLAIMDYVFRQSDVHAYFFYGGHLAQLLRMDFAKWAPEILKFILQRPNDLALYFPSEFSGLYATSSMTGTVGILMFLLNDAQYASFSFMASLAFFGKLASYRGFRLVIPALDASKIAIATMLIPSVVFWSSGVVKESWATIGLGILTLWLARVSTGTITTSPHLFVLGILPVALIKPYLLFPLTLGSGAWYLMSRQKSSHATVQPLFVAFAAGATIALMGALSAAFPEFSLDEIGTSAATMQQYGARTGGGSNYSLGNTQATTLGGQLAFAPIALITVLLRPFIFEVRNFSMLIASCESTLLLALLIQLFRKNSVRSVLTLIFRAPPLVYCLIFTLVAGLAIGLATSNFGTLSRYRIPMMPQYVLLVFALIDKRTGVTATQQKSLLEDGVKTA